MKVLHLIKKDNFSGNLELIRTLHCLLNNKNLFLKRKVAKNRSFMHTIIITLEKHFYLLFLFFE